MLVRIICAGCVVRGVIARLYGWRTSSSCKTFPLIVGISHGSLSARRRLWRPSFDRGLSSQICHWLFFFLFDILGPVRRWRISIGVAIGGFCLSIHLSWHGRRSVVAIAIAHSIRAIPIGCSAGCSSVTDRPVGSGRPIEDSGRCHDALLLDSCRHGCQLITAVHRVRVVACV